ncbi:MAG: beta-ketoadipate enol-lactone hydrolase [Frankiales bacterium]|nr:beta-ketoadipate enol-lactone hydrolase [Frankiales bacterium]
MTTLAAPTRVAGVEVTVVGTGLPVTVYAHGLGGSSVETRPLAARTPGTRVLLTFRGHGASAAIEGGWTYDDLADDLREVADAFGATRAAGLSLGAGALLRLLSRTPDRFERIAFVLPAAIDESRDDLATARLLRLADALIAGDEAHVVRMLLEDVPESVRTRGGVRVLVDRRARQLLGTVPPYPRGVDAPLRDLRPLAGITAPALVIAQRDDPLHPAAVAERLTRALPAAELLMLEPGGVFWTETRRTQDALATHLCTDAPEPS